MPKITNIIFKDDRERYWIYVDGKYCTSIRARTFKGMNLTIGASLSCEEIKEMESFHFKNQYKDSWEQEKVRIGKVSQLLSAANDKIRVNVTGFGADSNDYIKEHPDEQGKPDLELVLSGDEKVLMLVEVTGTTKMRGDAYWIRPDKLSYCQNHPEENVWIVLHYALPVEKFVFVKPNGNKQYEHIVVNIKGTDELYVPFKDCDQEVYSYQQFLGHLDFIIKQNG
ncbi:hypothetical protein [Shewanella algae]|uniref:hypothetical protein n=1 Tax=Shewanella algae TaxID=38313 RepID=UPI001C590ACC|nr:hypothetical protein [Shewanella algae]